MATADGSLSKTLELLFEIASYGAEKTFDKIKTVAPIYFKSLIKLFALWLGTFFLFVILKALTGFAIFAWLGVFLGIPLVLILGFWGAPLGVLIGMLRGETLNPAIAGEKYVRAIATILFVECLASLYVIKMPIENNPEALPMLLLCGTALVVGIYLWGSWISPKMYILTVAATMAYTTASLFDPQPIDYFLWKSGLKKFSSYQGRRYGSTETIAVQINPQEFSDYITLIGRYKVISADWVEFLPYGSDKPTRIPDHTWKRDTDVFSLRGGGGLVIFTPTGR